MILYTSTCWIAVGVDMAPGEVTCWTLGGRADVAITHVGDDRGDARFTVTDLATGMAVASTDARNPGKLYVGAAVSGKLYVGAAVFDDALRVLEAITREGLAAYLDIPARQLASIRRRHRLVTP